MCLPFYRAGRVSEYIIYLFSHLLSKMGHMVSRVNRGERSTAGAELDSCQLCWRVGTGNTYSWKKYVPEFREDTTSRWCATEVDDDGVMMPVGFVLA